MEKRITFLTPIKVKTPPYHTQVIPKCFTCSHFPTCTTLRGDYLKTALLIQNVLGDPQEDYCLCKSSPDKVYPCYEGMPIENPETIFPEHLTFTKRVLITGEILTEPVDGKLESAKYQDINTVLFMYNSGGYKILFKALYDEDKKEFIIYDGKEIVYYMTYEFPQDNVLEVQVNLDNWREEMIEKESFFVLSNFIQFLLNNIIIAFKIYGVKYLKLLTQLIFQHNSIVISMIQCAGLHQKKELKEFLLNFRMEFLVAMEPIIIQKLYTLSRIKFHGIIQMLEGLTMPLCLIPYLFPQNVNIKKKKHIVEMR